MWRCNEELRVLADELHRSSKRDAKHFIGNLQMLVYLLKFFCDVRIIATLKICYHHITIVLGELAELNAFSLSLLFAMQNSGKQFHQVSPTVSFLVM